MQSAPVHMPATTVASLGAGFADPDLIRGATIGTFSDRSESARSAGPISSPAPGPPPTRDDRRRTLLPPRRTYAKLAPEVPFRTGPDCCVRTTIVPVQSALSSFRHPANVTIHRWIEA